jgi:hypothetical protein
VPRGRSSSTLAGQGGWGRDHERPLAWPPQRPQRPHRQVVASVGGLSLSRGDWLAYLKRRGRLVPLLREAVVDHLVARRAALCLPSPGGFCLGEGNAVEYQRMRAAKTSMGP